jgi:hypothetical protein
MKTLLVLLILIVGITLVCVLPIDLIQSALPGWRSTKIPDYIRFIIVVVFNIGLPILFFSQLKEKIKPQLFVGYFLVINLLYFLNNFWPKNFLLNSAIDSRAYFEYTLTLICFFIAALFIHSFSILYLPFI